MSLRARPLPSPLLAIADFGLQGDRLPELAALAARGGLRWVLLRARDAAPEQREEILLRLMAAAPGLLVSVHGDGPLAKRRSCAGVHYSSAELERCWEERGGLVAGGSCHSREELERATSAKADYCFLSPVRDPSSKPAVMPPLGFEEFGRLASAARVPVYALGGMRPEDAEEVAQRGGAGIAVIGDLWNAEDVEARANEWVRAAASAFGKV